MARNPRDSRLETRSARLKLKQRRKPYYRQLSLGVFIGYRRTKANGTWVCRLPDDKGGYRVKAFARADDHAESDGESILNYGQAVSLIVNDAVSKPDLSQDLTVEEVMKIYLERHLIPHTKSGKGTKLTIERWINKSLGSIKVAQLTRSAIDSWHKELPRKIVQRKSERSRVEGSTPKTQDLSLSRASSNRILTSLKAGLNFAKSNGLIDGEPVWSDVKPFREANLPRERFLTLEESKKLIEACPDHFKLLVKAALLTGARYGELCRLKSEDVRLETGIIFVRESKSGKPRYIPLSLEGRVFFKELQSKLFGQPFLLLNEYGDPWGKSQQHRRIREACKKSEISGRISFHTLRHTYASLLALKGTPIAVIAKVLGHSDSRICEKHYTHLQPDYVAEVISTNLPVFFGKVDKQVKPRQKQTFRLAA